ncbi:MAG: glycosyltransferase [Candidatus Thorarchaeota archaeon]
MIKVCHIVNIITGKSDGVYAHLKMIFTNSDKSKFQHYLIFQGGEKIEKELSEMGIEFFVSRSFKKKISIKAFRDVYNFIKKNNISIIHTHLIKPYTIAGLLNIFLRKKFIFNYHGIFISNNPYYGFLEKSIYRLFHYVINFLGKTDVVLVPSKKSKELLMNETHLFPEPVVYYNGYNSHSHTTEINYDLYNQIKDIKSDRTIIALVGRLEIDKRIDKAIEVFNNIIYENKKNHLLIFGDGKLEDDLRKLIDDLGLNKYINIFGHIEDINNYYNLFDIVLFTSDWEGMPLSMWEALGNKIPVVAPDVGGFSEILVKHHCGLVYRPDNIDEAKENILELLDNVKLRNELGLNGFEVVRTKYNPENFIRKIEITYRNLFLS